MTDVGVQIGARVGVEVGGHPLKQLGALALWDAREPWVKSSGGLATEYMDSVGGYKATSSGALRPTYNATGPSPNGRPSLSFAGAQRMTVTLTGPLLDAVRKEPLVAYVSFRVTNGGANREPVTITAPATTNGDGLVFDFVSTTASAFFINGSSFPSANIGPYAVGTDYWAYGHQASSTSHKGRLRGRAEVENTTALTWPTTQSQITFGARANGGTYNFPFIGHLYTFALFRLLTSAQHAVAQSWFDRDLGL